MTWMGNRTASVDSVPRPSAAGNAIAGAVAPVRNNGGRTGGPRRPVRRPWCWPRAWPSVAAAEAAAPPPRWSAPPARGCRHPGRGGRAGRFGSREQCGQGRRPGESGGRGGVVVAGRQPGEHAGCGQRDHECGRVEAGRGVERAAADTDDAYRRCLRDHPGGGERRGVRAGPGVERDGDQPGDRQGAVAACLRLA